MRQTYILRSKCVGGAIVCKSSLSQQPSLFVCSGLVKFVLVRSHALILNIPASRCDVKEWLLRKTYSPWRRLR